MNQEDFSKEIEKAYKKAIKNLDSINANAEKIRNEAVEELQAAKELKNKAEQEGHKMAQEYFENARTQLIEAARTELLRDLVRKHLLEGEKIHEIAHWLNVPKEFIKEIKNVIDRNSKYNKQNMERILPDGKPKLLYVDMGRGGTIYYESSDARFDMWWEFAGGKALVILDIPTPDQWTARTGLPLSQRKKVLNYIGEQIGLDKISSGGSFIIGENVITFYGPQ
ncbi:MAG: hypothetical protein KA251_00445 [Saprospiraceae bacterium]|nr:hypothetical protein [Candidatus Vicinibacter affinis]MBP6172999.1 hypothetical protein [Saprospiraceae bacterium]MBK6824655.1 hypothetical protein [Candidatus Vicinibacter affinis]MBK7302607.1 hypothetical protein [Candidatus Vicinibacter affinis]MBK7798533.1 hypothetical protein [Candidatus Vicinibacter affinis]